MTVHGPAQGAQCGRTRGGGARRVHGGGWHYPSLTPSRR